MPKNVHPVLKRNRVLALRMIIMRLHANPGAIRKLAIPSHQKFGAADFRFAQSGARFLFTAVRIALKSELVPALLPIGP